MSPARAVPPSAEASMSEPRPELQQLPKHPIGTFAFVGAYAVLFVAAWYAIYVLVFLARRPVTP